ncbi:Homocysteine S-methyltransferase [Gilbertella persicaria]|uniref:Homocysteine S-methyltransferase n=1 Tax=Gilbertella persicaria TaxID=101096 RepID=UPI00221F74EA|nr:Homocysteine S-methyltransferase [Gilbertella persicaria]KAI8067012.1 Homocysteine S-methyltransferase [Gilbertella persicaria]
MYYEAGANVATSCSYQASMQGFLNAGYTKEQAIQLMQKSVALAIEARDEFKQVHPEDKQQRLVALSIGCYGAVLANGAEYTGDYGSITVDQLVEFHASRLAIFLASSKVDLIMFETIPSYLEAQAIQKVVQGADLPPVAVAFQCRSSDQIADGTPVLKALEALSSDKIFALGINCTKPKYVEALFETVSRFNQDHGHRALIAYPDGGEEWNAVARSWDSTARLPEEAFGCMMSKCIQTYGPKVLVGGCCGTGPVHIKNIREFS